jgi:hypothetical protein
MTSAGVSAYGYSHVTPEPCGISNLSGNPIWISFPSTGIGGMYPRDASPRYIYMVVLQTITIISTMPSGTFTVL